MKTIREIANELNVSKQAVDKRMKALQIQPTKVDGKYQLTEEQAKRIIEYVPLQKHIHKPTNQEAPTETPLQVGATTKVGELRRRMKDKDDMIDLLQKQIDIKDEEIKRLQVLLLNEQENVKALQLTYTEPKREEQQTIIFDETPKKPKFWQFWKK